MTVDIICPLYNAKKYIRNLQKSLEMQKDVNILSIRYIVTNTEDGIENELKKLKCKFRIIGKEEFSHSLIREEEAFKSEADLVVFITQDVKIEKDNWLFELIKPIEENEADATYSRQICKDKTSIEYYTRQKNYPDISKLKTKNDIKDLGMNAFFFSDASSCIKRDVFVKLNGYDNKNFPTNEDMYIAYKLLNNGYRIKYVAESEVIHSHKFTLRQTFNRYKAYGEFLKMEPELNIKSTKAGSSLAKFIMKEALKDRNFSVILKFFPDMCSRYIGMKVGKKIGKQN